MMPLTLPWVRPHAMAIWVWLAAGALNWNSEPPLKSTLKFSPPISSASTAISRISPETM